MAIRTLGDMSSGREGEPGRYVRGSRRRKRPVAARTTIRGVVLIQFAANTLGALVVLTYLQLLFPEQLDADQRDTLNLVIFSTYLLATVIVAVPVNARLLRDAMAWLSDGRRPTDAELKETLAQPFRQTTSAFIGWVGAAVIFSILNEDTGRIAFGIALAGLMTCAIIYLWLEWQFRPIFALALVDADIPQNRHEILPRLLLAWLIGSAIPLFIVGIAPVVIPANEFDYTWRLGALILGVLVVGGLLMVGAAGAVSDPINRVRNAMRQVEEGDFDVSLRVDDTGEIGRLQNGFNAMVAGLRERDELRGLLEGQVGEEVARHSLETPPSLGGGRRVVTVLFVDLRGYTEYAEIHTPEEVVDMLNRFFGAVVDVVHDEGGHVNKFEGDAALCVFGAPEIQLDHAARALRAAAAIPAAIVHLPETPSAGIGVATGTVVAGYVGTSDRYEYTVIGDIVNVAARLTDEAKAFGAGVLATATTVESAGRVGADWQSAGTLNLRGRLADAEVYEPQARPHPAA